MKTNERVFLGSAIFAAGIALIYWFRTHEPAGTILLALMGGAVLIVYGYVVVKRRELENASDDDDARPQDAAGESLGWFSKATIWPLLLAISLFLMMAGLVFGLWLLGVGFAFALGAIYQLMRNSAA